MPHAKRAPLLSSLLVIAAVVTATDSFANEPAAADGNLSAEATAELTASLDRMQARYTAELDARLTRSMDRVLHQAFGLPTVVYIVGERPRQMPAARR